MVSVGVIGASPRVDSVRARLLPDLTPLQLGRPRTFRRLSLLFFFIARVSFARCSSTTPVSRPCRPSNSPSSVSAILSTSHHPAIPACIPIYPTTVWHSWYPHSQLSLSTSPSPPPLPVIISPSHGMVHIHTQSNSTMSDYPFPCIQAAAGPSSFSLPRCAPILHTQLVRSTC